MGESGHSRRFFDRRGTHRYLYTAAFIGLFPMALTGCAVHYFDPDTGAEHVWGFGHLVMKAQAPETSHRALVRGMDLWGLNLGKTDEGYGLGLGWNRYRRVDILDPNTQLILEWPSADLLNLRIGSSLPTPPIDAPSETNQE